MATDLALAGGGSPPVENEEQFWKELAAIFSRDCAGSHESIDDALRAWLYLVASCRELYLVTEDDVASCSQLLVDSRTFCQNRDYVRTQIIYSLLQEDEAGPIHAIANLMLLDGRSDEAVFRRMMDEGCFPRLVGLINGTRDNDRRLHRLLLELVYEMSRIERVRPEDLALVTDDFVTYMFQVIESLSDDVDDPYHYPVIRVLLVLNEQYMVASTTAAVDPASAEAAPLLTNRIIKVLSLRGPDFRTFGENIILLLNRETETSLQLLILKLLYLLFTTKATYEYFYTNDLHVLLDVIVRNLLDLPNESTPLRHTYLRVLYPLLAHTQLSRPPHYKREEINRMLWILGGADNTHFAPADETTVRLVDRVSKVEWLSGQEAYVEGEVARKLLGISLSESQTESSVSVVDVAAVMEKPGVKTPSRKDDQPGADALKDEIQGTSGEAPPLRVEAATAAAAAKPKKVRPEVPTHRHGRLLTPSPSPPVPVNGSGHDNSAATNSGGAAQPQKKIPPKAPPPRRGTRLRQAASAANLRGPESTPVS